MGEELLLGALLLGGQLAPELVPRGDGHLDGAKEAGEVAVGLKDHDALHLILNHAVDTAGVVDRHLLGGEVEVRREHLAVRVAGDAGHRQLAYFLLPLPP